MFLPFGYSGIELLIDAAFKTTILLCLAIGCLSVWRRNAPALRHYILTITCLTALCLPLIMFAAPSWKLVSLPPIVTSDESELTVSTSLISLPTAESNGITPQPDPVSAFFDIIPHWSILITLFWGYIAIAIIYRFEKSARQLSKLRVSGTTNDKRLLTITERIRNELGISRSIKVYCNSSIGIPFASGSFSPAVYLPQSSCNWSLEKLRAILIHELAHVKRWDSLLNRLNYYLCALHWFNPLVFLINRHLYIEREKATDEVVLRAGIKPSSYAQYLMEVISEFSGTKNPSKQFATLAHKNNMRQRIESILTVSNNSKRTSKSVYIAILIVLLTLLVPLAGIRTMASTDSNKIVSEQDREEILKTFGNLFNELNSGNYDYYEIRNKYFTDDYFDEPESTYELYDESYRESLMKNTLDFYKEIFPKGFINSFSDSYITRINDEFVLSQKYYLTVNDLDTLLNGIKQNVRFAKIGNDFKVCGTDGGMDIIRMDVINPYGPIFLLRFSTVSDSRTTVPFIFKFIAEPQEPGPVPELQKAVQLSQSNFENSKKTTNTVSPNTPIVKEKKDEE